MFCVFVCKRKHPFWDSTAQPYWSTSLHTPEVSYVHKDSSPKDWGQVTLVAKKPEPAERFWKCRLRNAVTCLPKWRGAPSCCSDCSRLTWRETSNNTWTSSSRKRRYRSDVKRSSSANGPMAWLPIAPHQMLTGEQRWRHHWLTPLVLRNSVSRLKIPISS